MRGLLRRYFVIVVSVYSASQLIPAFVINNNWTGIFYAAFILSLLFYISKPIINLLMLPINLLTLNLTAWLVNIILVYLWILLDKDLKIGSWEFSGLTFGPLSFSAFNFTSLQTTVILSILLTLLIGFFSWLIK